MPAPDDTVTLIHNGTILSGWKSVRVTRGIERIPSDFLLSVTEKYPGVADDLVITPGAPVEVRIGGDLVISGYLDRYEPSISPNAHDIRLAGRGKGADLVDCSLIHDGNQMVKISVLDLARKLAEPYGVTVATAGDAEGAAKVVNQINLLLGETPFEVIERVARWAKLLAYEGTDGNLILANVGTEKHASGFRQGQNVQSASASWGMDQRFSEYIGFLLSSASYGDLGALQGRPGEASIRLGDASDPEAAALKRADGSPRRRRHVVISEQYTFELGYVAKARAEWEMQRRWGRGQAVRLTADSWRDSDGRLWEPNRKAVVHLPALKAVEAEWVISEVTYAKAHDGGTVAEVTLMPEAAFAVQPEAMQQVHGDIAEALRGNARTGNPNSPDYNPRRNDPAGGI